MVKWACEYIEFDAVPLVCMKRAELTYPELIPIISYMASNWEAVEDDEGPVYVCRAVPPLMGERGDLTELP
jgi:hypothetical protein